MLRLTLVDIQQMLVIFLSFFLANILSANEQIGHSNLEKNVHYHHLLTISVAAWWEVIQVIFFVFYIYLNLQNWNVFLKYHLSE